MDLQAPGTQKTTTQVQQNERLRHACQEFESVFVAYLLKNMHRTVPKTDVTGGGLQGDMYMSMMDDAIAQAASKGTGIGLAAALYRQLSESKKI